MSDAAFKQNLPLILCIVELLEHWPRKGVTAREIATALGIKGSDIYKLFDDVLGVKPRSWEFPDSYNVEDVLESCVRHEVSQSYSRP